MFQSKSPVELGDILGKVENCCIRSDAIRASMKINGLSPNLFHAPDDTNTDIDLMASASWEVLSQLTICRGEFLMQNVELIFHLFPAHASLEWKIHLTEEKKQHALLYMDRAIQALEAFEMSTLLCVLWVVPHEPLFAHRLASSFSNVTQTIKQAFMALGRILSSRSKFLKSAHVQALEKIALWLQKTLGKSSSASPEMTTFHLTGRMFIFSLDMYLDVLVSTERLIAGNDSKPEHTLVHLNRLFRAVLRYKPLESHILSYRHDSRDGNPSDSMNTFPSFGLYPGGDATYGDSLEEAMPRPFKTSSTLPPMYDNLAQNIMTLDEVRKRTRMTLRKTPFPDALREELLSSTTPT